MSEQDRIARLARVLGVPANEAVIQGIGDDAAVLAPPGDPLVWTVDAQVDGTHFRRNWASWEDIGYRSYMAAASDLAAMGAEPLAALSSLVLADDVDDAALDALAAGQAEAARVVRAPVVGGNLARGRETSITTTLLGASARPVLRSGARPGDHVLLAGALGLAAAGLAVLEAGSSVAAASCLAAWRRPRALVDAGRAMRDVATACADVSDGLAADLGHVALQSSVAIVIDETALRALVDPELVAVARAVGRDPLDLVVRGGEDYALVVTSPQPIAGFIRIGTVEGGRGVRLASSDGSRSELVGGYDHFG